ncbi:TerB family tellurite resistance protein [Desulfonema limicola]|nr:TerB family tellurite resistance protein [Desulfonema limicola]
MENILNQFNEFDADAYLHALIIIAKADGIDQREVDFINLHSSLLGIDPSEYWKEDTDFSEFDSANLSRMTKMAIIRDCIVIAHIDGDYADVERKAITEIASRFGLKESDVVSMENWLKEYWQILEKGKLLLTGETQ